MKRLAVALLSGGLDSSVLIHQLLFEDFAVVALAVDYGQRHRQELGSAELVAQDASIPLKIVNLDRALGPIFTRARSSQVGSARIDVPHGHYAAASMQQTIVPNRNMLLLSVAGALAASLVQVPEYPDKAIVAYAAHAGDHAIYPDCRPEFYESCAETLFQATGGAVTLYAPFGTITKKDIVERGHLMRVPFALTYSCYEGGERHCGLCGTCVERREAFAEAGVEDPTEYSA